MQRMWRYIQCVVVTKMGLCHQQREVVRAELLIGPRCRVNRHQQREDVRAELLIGPRCRINRHQQREDVRAEQRPGGEYVAQSVVQPHVQLGEREVVPERLGQRHRHALGQMGV